MQAGASFDCRLSGNRKLGARQAEAWQEGLGWALYLREPLLTPTSVKPCLRTCSSRCSTCMAEASVPHRTLSDTMWHLTLHYCCPNGGNVTRDLYYNLNHNTGTHVLSFKDNPHMVAEKSDQLISRDTT